ncbi:MAG: hypothetical protein E7588_08805 [Ruminococcaceae bacterium]|nr:hypothetical protein [Oscillospiraceae bacterium]
MAGVVILPEKVLKKLNARISPHLKVCFFSALLVGLAAHLYKITNWLPNWDSLVFRYDAQNMLALGRWFLPVACSFSSFYDLPFLNGMAAIIFHALGAVFICKTLNVKKKITSALIGAFIVSFTSVTSVMMYNYVADGYSIAFFLSTLAAFYMTKEKPNYLISTALIVLSSGIYQAYITVTIMLILLHLTDEIIFNNSSFKVILKKSVCMLLSGVTGVALYGVILKVLLGIFSVQLLDYQGASAAASLSSLDLAAFLYNIKKTFIDFFFDFSDGISIYVVLNIFVLVFTVLYYLKCIIKNKIYKSPAKILMIAVLGILLVPASGALAFINPNVDYHNLMLMGYSVFYLFFIPVYERGSEATKKRTAIKCWTVLTAAVIIIMNQVVISNVSYHKAQMAYEKSYGVLIRIADRIEQTPNSENCDKILVIGALDDSEAYSVKLPPEITGITDGYILRADDETVSQSVLCSALNDYCGTDYRFVSGQEKQALAQREDIKAMERWPSPYCVTVADDTLIIKLGTEGEN